MSSRTRFGISLFFQTMFDFFITPRHPELDSGSHFYFFKRYLIFLSLLCFYFFIKIITTSLRRGKQLGVRSPQFKFDIFTVIISSRMTPARLYRSRLDAAVQSSVALLGAIRCFLGHGLGLCPKNLPASK